MPGWEASALEKTNDIENGPKKNWTYQMIEKPLFKIFKTSSKRACTIVNAKILFESDFKNLFNQIVLNLKIKF